MSLLERFPRTDKRKRGGFNSSGEQTPGPVAKSPSTAHLARRTKASYVALTNRLGWRFPRFAITRNLKRFRLATLA